MGFAARGVLAMLSATALGGCIAAAAIPIGAAGLIGREQITRSDDRPDGSIAPPAQRIAALPEIADARVRASAASLPNVRVEDAAPSVTAAPAAAEPVGAARGSYGDSYDGLTRYLFAKAQARDRGAAVQSVVLFPDTQIEHPDFTVCGDMPLAMIVDLDKADTVAIAQSDPEMVEAVTTARMAGVAVHFSSDRPSEDAPIMVAALDAAGLGPVKHGENLWMAGDRAGTGKDSLRWKIAGSHCVVALVGQRPGDFTQIYDDPATASGSPGLDAMRGNGWFLFPAPGAGEGR
jgi:hypothetical protein